MRLFLLCVIVPAISVFGAIAGEHFINPNHVNLCRGLMLDSPICDSRLVRPAGLAGPLYQCSTGEKVFYSADCLEGQP
jgi:hypothetical protein